MTDINSCTFTGRLTKDCEIKATQSGVTVVRFSIANNWYSSQAKKEEASFFDCVMFGKMADGLAPYLKKGTAVTISGELRQQRFQSNGENRSKIEIIVNSIKLQSEKKEETAAATSKASDDGLNGPESFDEIPF